jgi:hypothetical protein
MTLDSHDSPRPKLGGNHHLPPYSNFCVCPWHLHLNGFLSRNSQGGVSKLSRFRLPGLWKLITPSSDLQLWWGLKKTCNSPQELSNGVSHSTYTHRGGVDSRLLVVGSLPDPSFVHNMGCKCPNGSCKAILDIYTSRTFQRYKEHFNALNVQQCFDPLQSSSEFSGIPEDSKFPLLGVWISSSHLPQNGVATLWDNIINLKRYYWIQKFNLFCWAK